MLPAEPSQIDVQALHEELAAVHGLNYEAYFLVNQ
jgi:hypothetical protein